jgi:hypothetical protein
LLTEKKSEPPVRDSDYQKERQLQGSFLTNLTHEYQIEDRATMKLNQERYTDQDHAHQWARCKSNKLEQLKQRRR